MGAELVVLQSEEGVYGMRLIRTKNICNYHAQKGVEYHETESGEYVICHSLEAVQEEDESMGSWSFVCPFYSFCMEARKKKDENKP